MIYALDSNTVSYLLRSEGNVRQYFKKEISQAGNPYAIPLVVAYEVRRWLRDKPSRQLMKLAQQFDALFKNVQDRAEMPFTVWDKAVDIYIAPSLRRAIRTRLAGRIFYASLHFVPRWALAHRRHSILPDTKIRSSKVADFSCLRLFRCKTSACRNASGLSRADNAATGQPETRKTGSYSSPEAKQKGQLIGDADILIAAYCLVNNYTLVTRNTGDFTRIKGLKIVNWHE